MRMKNILKEFLPPVVVSMLRRVKRQSVYLKYRHLLTQNEALKDLHRGKRCFILGSAPSIKRENLSLLKDEIVLPLNNFYVHQDFLEIMSGNVPKYYVIAPIHPPQTEETWVKWFRDMETHTPQNVHMVLGLDGYPGNIKYLLDKYGLFKNHKINWYLSGLDISSEYEFKYKDIQLTRMLWAAATVSTYALIIALYMGFDEIYLLGVDCNLILLQGEDIRFYHSALHQQEEQKIIMKKSLMLKETAQVFFEKELIAGQYKNKIYNCSRESYLDMFEKKYLDRIL